MQSNGTGLVILAGASVGLVIVFFKRFGRTMSSFVLGLQSFPSIAYVPFAMLIIGLSDWGILFVMVMSSVLSVMLSVYRGNKEHIANLRQSGQEHGVQEFSLFRNVMLPAAMPSFISGIRQAWSFAWHALIGAEMLMTTVGLGAILYLASGFARMDGIIAAMMTIFFIGLAADRILFFRFEKRVRSRWGLTV